VTALEVSFTINAHGPLVDGRAPQIIHDWLDQVKQDIADKGVALLREVPMNKTGRGTGHYQAEITTKVVTGYNDVLIYGAEYWPGPWLEGVTKRNETTRFKGYRLWRETKRKLQDMAPDIAGERLPELNQKLGGG
jgi:hypothetical protein